ncbi:MAG: hypothetical protein U1E53_28800 [Dongiaceae bacterium]
MNEITSDSAGTDRPAITIRDRSAPLPPLPGEKSRVYFARDCDGEVYYLGHGESWRPFRRPDERLLSSPDWLHPAQALPTGCNHRWAMVASGSEGDELRCEHCGVSCRCRRELHRGRAVPVVAAVRAEPRLEEAAREARRLRKALLDVSAKAKAGAQALCFQYPKIADGFRLIQTFADQAAAGVRRDEPPVRLPGGARERALAEHQGGAAA